jgi:hypothetical protein
MFLFNLFPRYDFIQRKLELLTLDECLALPFIDLNNRSSTVEAEQEGIIEKNQINLGYDKEEKDLLIKDWRLHNYYNENRGFDNNEKQEYITQFVYRNNMNVSPVEPIFTGYRTIGGFSYGTTSTIDANILAMLDEENSKKNYWDINWSWDWKQSLGILNNNTILIDSLSLLKFNIEHFNTVVPKFSDGYNGTIDIIEQTVTPDTTPLGKSINYRYNEPNVILSAQEVVWLTNYLVGQPNTQFNLGSALHSHPILNFNNTYNHFYQNLLDKHNNGYRVKIKTVLRYSEFKDIIKGGLRKIKWNNDYFLLLEIDKYDLSTETGELTLLKAVGY